MHVSVSPFLVAVNLLHVGGGTGPTVAVGQAALEVLPGPVTEPAKVVVERGGQLTAVSLQKPPLRAREIDVGKERVAAVVFEASIETVHSLVIPFRVAFKLIHDGGGMGIETSARRFPA